MKRLQSETATTIAKVNVTPIIDVALVLVIILMITAPMIAVSDVDVKLPEAQTRNLEGHDRISVTLGPNGELAVDDQNLTLPALQSAIATRLADRKDVIVVIRADQSVAYAAVRRVVEAARAAGASRIAVGTQQRGQASSYVNPEEQPKDEPIHDAHQGGNPSRKDVKS
jgi:biopolymer transport protein TolR